jgi:hypothetical protein
LLPSFQFVAGKLSLFLVLAKIKLHVNVGHRFSLWRACPGVKTPPSQGAARFTIDRLVKSYSLPSPQLGDFWLDGFPLSSS